MNLIEKLGGYEKANNKLLKMDKILKEVYYSTSDAQKANELRQAILEYRRQHNIFEEGDWVVIPGRGNGIFQVNRLLSRTDVKEMEHATDAEIKAGKRRPELDSDTCSDIRNHISPLTKVIDR